VEHGLEGRKVNDGRETASPAMKRRDGRKRSQSKKAATLQENNCLLAENARRRSAIERRQGQDKRLYGIDPLTERDRPGSYVSTELPSARQRGRAEKEAVEKEGKDDRPRVARMGRMYIGEQKNRQSGRVEARKGPVRVKSRPLGGGILRSGCAEIPVRSPAAREASLTGVTPKRGSPTASESLMSTLIIGTSQLISAVY